MNSLFLRCTSIVGLCASLGASGCITVTNTFTGLPGNGYGARGEQMAANAYQEPRYIYSTDSSTYADHRYGYDPRYSRYDYRRYRDYGYYSGQTQYRYPSYPPITSNDPMPQRDDEGTYEDDEISPTPRYDDQLRGDHPSTSVPWRQTEGDTRRNEPTDGGKQPTMPPDQRARSTEEQPARRAEPSIPINSTQEPHPSTPAAHIPTTSERSDPLREASSRREEEQASRIPNETTTTAPNVATGPSQSTTPASGSMAQGARRADEETAKQDDEKKSTKSSGVGMERPAVNTDSPTPRPSTASGRREPPAAVGTPASQHADTTKAAASDVNGKKEVSSGSSVQATPRRIDDARAEGTETSVRQPAIDTTPASGTGIGAGTVQGNGTGSAR